MREEEKSFHEVLGDTLEKAPYLLISLAIHALAALLLAGLAFVQHRPEPEVLLSVAAPVPPPPLETPVEPVPETEPLPIPEPDLVDSTIEEEVDPEPVEDHGDPDFESETVFDAEWFQGDIGLGAGAGGLRGLRGGPGGRRGGDPTQEAMAAALGWLHDHQAPEGFWDCDEFMAYDRDPARPASDGSGSPVNDVGVSALALLAFLGHGDTLSEGRFSDNIQRGISWLKANQLENGLFGDDAGNPTLYNHALATMAVGEAYYFSRTPILRGPLDRAVGLIQRARNDYAVWRYGLTPNGDNDTSITGWMVFALETARDCGRPVDDAAFRDAEGWFDTMTDAAGRTGYTLAAGAGSRPSRPRIYLERFPPDRSEALTAVALLCRIFMTDPAAIGRWQEHPRYEMMKKQADLIVATPPVWDPAGGSCDFYYWYYATYALHQWGGEHWKTWRKAIEQTLLRNQRREEPGDNFYGSWDPVGPWGSDGGRVYSTAIGALILQVYFRYGKVLGVR